MGSEELIATISNRTISEICGVLQRRGLSTEGRKAQLVERLAEDALAKGDEDDLLQSMEDSTVAPEDAAGKDQRMRDFTEQYIAEHLKDNKPRPLTRSGRHSGRRSPDPGLLASSLGPDAEPSSLAQPSSKAMPRRRSPPPLSARGRPMRGDERLDHRPPPPKRKPEDGPPPPRLPHRPPPLSERPVRERSRSRDRAAVDDSQARSLRTLSNALSHSGLKETLQALDEAIISGDVGMDIINDLEAKLSTAIDLMESLPSTEAAQQ